MTKYQKMNLLSALSLIGTVLFGLSLKSSLPALMPTKFDANGVAIKYAPVMASIFFLPIIATLIITLFTMMSKKNKTFWAQTTNQEAVAQTNLGIVLLITSMYVGTFLNAINYNQFYKTSFFAIGFGIFFLISAITMKKIEKNLLYGVRLPWTLKSEVNWKKTHELTSVLMIVSGIALFVLGFFTKDHLIILSLVGMTFLVPSFYSFKLRNLV
jgi:uncharacterized membrane protein